MRLKCSILSALVACTFLAVIVPVQSLPASPEFIPLNETNVVRANEHGELFGTLIDERGEIPANTRVLLESRQNPGFNYGSQKVRGVNLGGWLVAEPWITPSLFDNTGDNRVVDEWTFGQYVGDARSRLQAHWNSWITQDDFRQIAAANLNHVRIPIGYWALVPLQGEPYIKANQLDYLTNAVRWARQYGIKVMIDLHGAPGSQNGYDNSGKRGGIEWPNSYNNNQRAKAAIVALARRFAASEFAGTVTIIQLLNEPAGFIGGNMLPFTRQYYYDGYGATREVFPNVAVSIHDAFQNLDYWNGFMQPPNFQQVILDTHIYTVFNSGQLSQSSASRLGSLCDRINSLTASQRNLYTVVGEWTSAPTDCARYLNGRGIGSRYDGSFSGSYYIGSCSAKTGNGSNFSSAYKQQLRAMFQTQVSVYERASGWIYWTWKTESAADWDYQRGLAGGWISRNLGARDAAAC